MVRKNNVLSVTPTLPEKLSVTLTPTEAPLNISDYKIQFQNGSGKSGEADYVANLLRNAGFSDVVTANADSYKYSETSVQLNANTPSSIFTKINEALGSTYTVSSSSATLENYAAVVIVGKRK